MLRKLWEEADRLHRARIAHRSLRATNVVADGTGRPWVVDFSFFELSSAADNEFAAGCWLLPSSGRSGRSPPRPP